MIIISLDNFKSITQKQYQQVNGDFSQFLDGTMMVCLFVPIIKNLFTNISGNFNLSGIIKRKWIKSENDIKEIKKTKQQFLHFIPPFYEF